MAPGADRLIQIFSETGPQEALTAYLVRQRWFGAKGSRITTVRLFDYAPLPDQGSATVLAILDVRYESGGSQRYLLPIAINPAAESQTSPSSKTSIFTTTFMNGGLEAYDATTDLPMCLALLDGIRREARWRGAAGVFTCVRTSDAESIPAHPFQSVKPVGGEQSNTSIVYDRRAIFKLIRKLAPGVNPDCEVLEFLTTHTAYRHVPSLLGYMRYDSEPGDEAAYSATVGVLQTFVPNSGDGWTWTLDHLAGLLAQPREMPSKSAASGDPSLIVARRSEMYLGEIQRLGAMTAELHIALASQPALPAFAPEPVTQDEVAVWQDGMISQIYDAMAHLRSLPEDARERLGLRETESLERACVRMVQGLPLLARTRMIKIRIHGDYHLGQVLKTKDGFTILDFEGEPARSLDERRAKACPLKDVAGMLRSLNYAGQVAWRNQSSSEADKRIIDEWELWAVNAFLKGYRAVAPAGRVRFLPESSESVERLVRVFELDKAIYELRYELNNRPDWIEIPLTGLRRLLRADAL